MNQRNNQAGVGAVVVVLVVAAVLVLGLAGYWVYQANQDEDSGGAEQSAETSQQQIPEMEYEVQTIELKAVGDHTGDGQATRVFDGTTFTHTVTANIADPASDKFYEGWLVKEDGTFMSTGMLEKENGSYGLEFTASQDMDDYVNVVITEETKTLGLDNNPEEHVLEGSF